MIDIESESEEDSDEDSEEETEEEEEEDSDIDKTIHQTETPKVQQGRESRAGYSSKRWTLHSFS